MTVLIRGESNQTDLAWAAADPAFAGVMAQLVRALEAVDDADGLSFVTRSREIDGVSPSELRARGAL